MTPEMIKHLERLNAWRARSPADQLAYFSANQPESVKARLALVNDCPHRGGVLPVPMQPANCSRCGELSECRAGKGTVPGRVTLKDCLTCVSADSVRT